MKGYHIKMEGEEVNISLTKILTESAPEISRNAILFILFFFRKKTLKKCLRKQCVELSLQMLPLEAVDLDWLGPTWTSPQGLGSISRPKPKFPVQGPRIPLRFPVNQAGQIQSRTINHSHCILWVGVTDGFLLVMADPEVESRPEYHASCVSGLFGISQLCGALCVFLVPSLGKTRILQVFPVGPLVKFSYSCSLLPLTLWKSLYMCPCVLHFVVLS